MTYPENLTEKLACRKIHRRKQWLSFQHAMGLGVMVLVFLFCYVQGAQATITLVQKVSNTNTGASSIAATLPSAVTTGNFIVVTVDGYNTSVPSSFTIADSHGNSYVIAGVIKSNADSVFSAIYYAANVTGGTDTVTVTPSSGSPQLSIVVAEFSGVSNSSPLQTTASATGTGTTPSSGNMTPM